MYVSASCEQVILKGAALEVDFSATYSCMKGGERHCGGCKQCKDRQRAFIEAGLPEPSDFYQRS